MCEKIIERRSKIEANKLFIKQNIIILQSLFYKTTCDKKSKTNGMATF